MGPEVLTHFIPHFKKAIEDPKWRVRCEAYQSILNVSVKYHNPQLFQKELEPLLLNFLKDKVAMVRDTVVAGMDSLIATYKSDWVYSRLLPKLTENLSKDNSYLVRLAAIKTLTMIAKNVQPDSALDKIFPLLYKNLTDSVPNIRFTVIKQLFDLSKKFD